MTSRFCRQHVLVVLLEFLLQLTELQHSVHAQSDALLLEQEIANLVNFTLGFQDYTNYVNIMLRFTVPEADESHENGQKAIQQIAADLASRLQYHAFTVKSKLRDALNQAVLSSSDLAVTNCGSFAGGSYDPRFSTTVDLSSLCVEGIDQQPQLFFRTVMSYMTENLESETSLRWQYVTTETGWLYRYPAVKRDSTSVTSDPRLTPQYRSTTSPNSRDVIILIQTSPSVNTMLNVIKSAANVLLNSLNQKDRVAVVAFSSIAYTAASLGSYSDPCYDSQLADLTPKALSQLHDFVNGLSRSAGNANYSNAFATAFRMFNNPVDSNQPTAADRNIILLTDGSNMVNDYNNTVSVIRNGNGQLTNEVTIFVYSFSSKDQNANNLLGNLARQGFADNLYEHTPTDLIQMNATGDMRSQMSNFFSAVNLDLNSPVVYSSPFYDQLSGDLCMSLCLPVMLNGALYGTACVDVTISSLFQEVVYFAASSSSYVFLVDGNGHVLIHPLLPSPQSSSPETTPVSLNQIESDDNGQITQLQQDMTNSTKTQGIVTIRVRQVYPRGYTRLEGVNTAMVTSTYLWQKVNGTNFTVCLVTTDGYVNTSVIWTESSYPQVFLSEEFELASTRDSIKLDLCSFGSSGLAMRNKSSIKLAPQCFNDPQFYIDQPITSEVVKNWTNFLEGKVDYSSQIQDNVRAAVASTAHLEAIWQSRPFDSALWRYIGLREGIIRSFPGHQLVKRYSPTERPWYRQAVANPNSFTMYGPYPDASTDICVVTVAKAILRNTYPTMSTTIIGVMAMDFKLSYFNKILLDNFPSCSQVNEKCFMMDQGGFVIIHPDFLSYNTCNRDQHVTCLEPFVAQQMIKYGVLVSDFCVSFVNMNTIKFWKVILAGDFLTNPYRRFFDVYAIPQTNVFVVQIHTQNQPLSSPGPSCSCVAQVLPDGTQGTCQSFSNGGNISVTCEFPCYTATEYTDLCSGQLRISNRGTPPCIPPPPSLSNLSVNVTSQYCNCNSSSCQQFYPTTGTPNLLPLLALLALLLVPVIVSIVLCKMGAGENTCSKGKGKSVMTDSSAYVSYNATRYENAQQPDAETYAEIAYPGDSFAENGAFEGVRSDSADDRLQKQATSIGNDLRDNSGMTVQLADGIIATESFGADEKQDRKIAAADLESTYITTSVVEKQTPEVQTENPVQTSFDGPECSGQSTRSTAVTYLHTTGNYPEMSTHPTTTADAAASAHRSTALQGDANQQLCRQLPADDIAELSVNTEKNFTKPSDQRGQGEFVPQQPMPASANNPRSSDGRGIVAATIHTFDGTLV